MIYARLRGQSRWLLPGQNKFLSIDPMTCQDNLAQVTKFYSNAAIDCAVMVSLLLLPGQANGQLANNMCRQLKGLSENNEQSRDLVLAPAGKHALSDHHNACEHVNRSCQRLRKKGLLVYRKRAWWPSTEDKRNG